MQSREVTGLREFLRTARARIAPGDIGFPVASRRRSRGLRRDEVAELAGISENWYARFETGRAQLSISAIERVAHVLRLDRDERAHLLTMARPELAAFNESSGVVTSTGLGASIAGLRDLARACAKASSFDELAAHAAQVVHRLCGAPTLAYVRTVDEATSELAVAGAAGPGAGDLLGHRQSTADVAYAMRYFLEGRPYGEADLERTPSVDLRRRVERLGVRAYYTQPILADTRLDSMIGVAFPEPRVPSELERSVLEAAAAVVELALR